MKVSVVRSRSARLSTALLLIVGLVVLVPVAAAIADETDIVINEIMNNPAAVSDADGEWFEVVNVGDVDVDIDGWTISDDDVDSHVIDNGGPLIVPAGGFLVLGNNADSSTNGGVAVAYDYGDDFFLSNSGDELVLTNSVEIDRVEWDNGATFPDPNGASMSLNDPADDNSVGANWCEATSSFGDGDLGTPGAANDGCESEPPPPPPPPGGELCDVPTTHTIPAIQGSGFDSSLDGTPVVVQGVVTGVFPASDIFSIQDPAGDGDPATSDGIHVFAPGATVALGDTAIVSGTVDEFFGLTEITNVTGVEVCGTGGSVAATLVPMPLEPGASFEPYEGMLVTFDTLYVSDTFNLHRFGEVLMSSGGPLQIPTDVVEPGVAANEFQDLNDRSTIVLDDADGSQFPVPVPYLAADNTLRRGDTVDGIQAVMGFNFGAYKIWPSVAPTFVRANPRPALNDVGGPIKVASFNVLNYFTTIDTPENDARGADSEAELVRQEAKLAEALMALGADIVGLQELESGGQIDVPGNPNAQQDLVDALNAIDPNPTWAAVADPDYPGGLGTTNAIKVGIIYRTDRATPVGASMSDTDPVWAEDRPPVAQTFMVDGDLLTVVVNHFKSKGSSDAVGPDLDQGDGQGAYNFRRTKMAERLLVWLDDVTMAAGDPDVVVLGDFNSYSMEDPIEVLRGGLNEVETDNDPYSLVFFGQQGQLDYVFVTDSLASRISGATTWHINADEPRVLDYNDDVIDPAERSSDFSQLYFVDEFRSSDHDPTIVGIKLATPRSLKEQAAATVAAMLDAASGRDATTLRRALEDIEDSLDVDLWRGEVLLDPRFGHRVFSAEKRAMVWIEQLDGNAESVIHNLLSADRGLAVAAIEMAANTGADDRRIMRAEAAVAVGDALRDAGRYAQAVDRYRAAWREATSATNQARFATYNASLNRGFEGQLISDLSTPGNAQAQVIAEVIQRTRPEVLLVNEFDYDAGGVAADLFRANYLEVPQNGQSPIYYPYAYQAPSNTGVYSGFDLDNSGAAGDFVPNDSFGFGFFPGQYGMLVLSMHPIDYDNVRTFQNFLWKDMPGALLPDDPDVAGPADWYSPAELEVFRLSSKSHWDVPVEVAGKTIHFLVSHPTPPVFDGPEDRNGTRNHDEIRFWADYVDPEASGYIYDDEGGIGGLSRHDRFVIAGDQNSDPFDGDSIPGAAQLLLDHPLVNTTVTPASEGAVEAAAVQGRANDSHIGDPKFDTADFSDFSPGNLRADYVLPSVNLDIVDAAVFWPTSDDPLYALVGDFPFPGSDHRLVWVDIATKRFVTQSFPRHGMSMAR